MAIHGIVDIYSNDGETVIVTFSTQNNRVCTLSITDSGLSFKSLYNGVEDSTSEEWVYDGTKNFLGLSKTQGSNSVDNGYGIGNTISFDNMESVNFYIVEGEPVTPTLTYNLTKLNLAAGTHNITVVAKAEGYLNSAPSNSVEYTVEADSIVGTWLFNESINVNGGAWYSVNFTSNGVSYIAFSDRRDQTSAMHDMSLRYFKTPTTYDLAFGGDGSWRNEAYRTITISEEPTDEEFIVWLKANATKQGESPSLPLWNGTDLTGTTWHVPAGWVAESGYKISYITGSIEYNNKYETWPECLRIGYSSGTGKANTITWGEAFTFQGSISSETEFSITFTGGRDVTSMDVIAWIRHNGELISHTLPEQGKQFTKGYTVTMTTTITGSESNAVNDTSVVLSLLDGSHQVVRPWDEGTWTDVVFITCDNYVGFTENGLANYLENGIYYLSADIAIDKIYWVNCIDENTLVTMADGSAKRLGDVEVGDEVLSIDYDTMTLIARKVIYSGKDEPDYDNWFVNCYWENVFSDGTVIKQAMNHRFYNLENELYVYMKDWNTGEHTYKLDGTNPELVSRTLVQGRINYGRITLENSNNYFANGLSTADRRACPNKVVLNAPLQRQ